MNFQLLKKKINEVQVVKASYRDSVHSVSEIEINLLMNENIELGDMVVAKISQKNSLVQPVCA